MTARSQPVAPGVRYRVRPPEARQTEGGRDRPLGPLAPEPVSDHRGGLNSVFPQIHVHLEHQNVTLCGNRVFADVIS